MRFVLTSSMHPAVSSAGRIKPTQSLGSVESNSARPEHDFPRLRDKHFSSARGRRAPLLALLPAAEGVAQGFGLRLLVSALQRLVDCWLARSAHWRIPRVQRRAVRR